MTLSIRLDHLVIAVLNLECAVRDYGRLGFNVTPGGTHTHTPTRNALVSFFDGTYLELIEWLEPAKGEKWYEQLHNAGEGVAGFALCPDDVAAIINRTGGHDSAYRTPVLGSRVQPTGEEIRWLLGWPVDEALPFLCADVTSRDLRVPKGACQPHDNGVTGIGKITVGVRNLDTAIQVYEQLLQTKPTYPFDAEETRERQDLRVATFRIGGADLVLVEPEPVQIPEAEALRDQLMRRGPGVYRITLTAVGEKSALLDPALTHGAMASILAF